MSRHSHTTRSCIHPVRHSPWQPSLPTWSVLKEVDQWGDDEIRENVDTNDHEQGPQRVTHLTSDLRSVSTLLVSSLADEAIQNLREVSDRSPRAICLEEPH